MGKKQMRLQNNEFRPVGIDLLELKTGGGCLSIFGLPFLLAGIFMLLATVGIIPFSNASEVPGWSYLLMGLMALVFCGVGAALVFGRSWVILNRRAGSVIVAKGLLVPMDKRHHLLKDYNCIELRFQPGDSDTADSYTLWLKSDGSELRLYSGTDYGIAVSEGLKLSEFTGYDLMDKSSDHAQLVSVKEIPEPTTEPDSDLRKPLRPQYLHCLVEEGGSDLKISVPLRPLKPWMLLEAVIPLVILVFVLRPLLAFFYHTNTPVMVGNFFIFFILMFFVVLPLLGIIRKVFSAKGFECIIHVNMQGIRVWYPRQSKKGIMIDSSEIISLDYSTQSSQLELASQEAATAGIGYRGLKWIARYARAKGVIIKSRKGLFYLVPGQSDEETLYLYRLISYYLAEPTKK